MHEVSNHNQNIVIPHHINKPSYPTPHGNTMLLYKTKMVLSPIIQIHLIPLEQIGGGFLFELKSKQLAKMNHISKHG
jgi:hypothetical protein